MRPGPPGHRGNQYGSGSGSFTAEQDAFILANYRPGTSGGSKVQGMTTEQIAKHLGRKRNSIVSRYHRLMRDPIVPIRYSNVQKQVERQVPSMPKLKFLGEA